MTKQGLPAGPPQPVLDHVLKAGSHPTQENMWVSKRERLNIFFKGKKIQEKNGITLQNKSKAKQQSNTYS